MPSIPWLNAWQNRGKSGKAKKPPGKVRKFSRKNGFSWPPHPNQILAWCFLILITVISLGFSVSLASPGSYLTITFNLAMATLVCILKLMATIKDPGVITAISKPNFYTTERPVFIPGVTAPHVVMMRQDGSPFGDCHVCGVVVPRGTKHCRQCNKCIMEWDHHCIWLNNCVGSTNMKRFLLFVRTTSVSAALQSVYHIVLLILFFTNPKFLGVIPQESNPNATTKPVTPITTTPPTKPDHRGENSTASQSPAANVCFFGAAVPKGVWITAAFVNLLLNLITTAATANLAHRYYLENKERQSRRESLAAKTIPNSGLVKELKTWGPPQKSIEGDGGAPPNTPNSSPRRHSAGGNRENGFKAPSLPPRNVHVHDSSDTTHRVRPHNSQYPGDLAKLPTIQSDHHRLKRQTSTPLKITSYSSRKYPSKSVSSIDIFSPKKTKTCLYDQLTIQTNLRCFNEDRSFRSHGYADSADKLTSRRPRVNRCHCQSKICGHGDHKNNNWNILNKQISYEKIQKISHAAGVIAESKSDRGGREMP